MKKGIKKMLACAGVGIAIAAGTLAIKNSANNPVSASAFTPAMCIDLSAARMPFKTFFDFPLISDTEREIAKEIRSKYDYEQKELLNTLKADIKETQNNILGARYSELEAEITDLKEQYKEQGIGFYNSPEYEILIELKNEQRLLVEQNKTELDEQIDLLTKKYFEDECAMHDKMRMELHLLQRTMCC